MKTKLRIGIRCLLMEIASTLPSGLPNQSGLAELLFAGMGLRNGMSMIQLASILPGVSVLRFRINLSRVLAVPELSIWYFDQLESFEERFLQVMGGCEVQTLTKIPAAVSFPGKSSHQRRPDELPAMPVAAGY